MSSARKLALRLKCPRQVQHRVRGWSWWSQPSAQGQARWVSQQMEILCADYQPLQHSFPSHSFYPRAQPAATLFVLQESCLCGKILCQCSWTWQRLIDAAGLVHLNSLLGEGVSHIETGLCAKEVLGGCSVATMHLQHTLMFLPGHPESQDRCPQ